MSYPIKNAITINQLYKPKDKDEFMIFEVDMIAKKSTLNINDRNCYITIKVNDEKFQCKILNSVVSGYKNVNATLVTMVPIFSVIIENGKIVIVSSSDDEIATVKGNILLQNIS